MTVYLGSLGRMVELYTTPSASVVAEERYSFSTTLEGRLKAQVRPVGRRTWTWSASGAEPRDVAALAQFTSGAWGPGPFVFVPADAPFTNMLSPAAASCAPESSAVAQGGPALLPDGSWAARSLLSASPANMFFGTVRTPVVAGRTVSAGAWVLGSGSVARLHWYDASGTALGSASSSVASTGGWVWSTVSAVAPAGAAGALLAAIGATQAANPVINWNAVVPKVWSDGQGCDKAVVHGLSRDLAFTASSRTFSNLAFTATEVG